MFLKSSLKKILRNFSEEFPQYPLSENVCENTFGYSPSKKILSSPSKKILSS